MGPLRERQRGAVLNWFLFAFSSILSATLRLLTCVPLPGSPHTYLYFDGNRDCSTAVWRVPLALLLVFLVGFVVFLPLFTFRLHRRRLSASGFHRVLCEHYRPEFYWFECALILQRLLLAFLGAFLPSSPVLRLVLMTLVCLCATVTHILVRPFASPSTQRLQTTLQLSLLVVSVCNIVPAAMVELGGISGGGGASTIAHGSQALLAVLEIAFVYVVPIAAILLSVPVGGLINPLLVLFR